MFLPSVSFGSGPGDAGPSGHSEEAHPLGVVLETNVATTFPLLYPSAAFGRLLRAIAQIWPHFSKRACTAARPLYMRLFFKYCQEQLDWNRFFSPHVGKYCGTNMKQRSLSIYSCSHSFICGYPPGEPRR